MLVTWRDVRSLGSIAGQNFLFSFAVGGQFFVLLLLLVLLLPLSTDPMQKIPEERRLTWPVLTWEWRIVRFVSVFLSPVAWLAILLLVTVGWRAGTLVFAAGVGLYFVKHLARKCAGALFTTWSFRIPAPPGVIGSIMRLQFRSMLHTLDPYLAFTLMASTELYRIFGKALDPAAPRIMSLLVALALSTEAQVLLGLDGRGAERYRHLPIRGWQILLAKDLAFLLLLGLLVLPLDFFSGVFGGLAALTVGHHNSVLKPIPQVRWRFTSGALVPHGVAQTVALFSVGSVVRMEGVPMVSICLLAWCVSVIFYGWQWDRRARG